MLNLHYSGLRFAKNVQFSSQTPTPFYSSSFSTLAHRWLEYIVTGRRGRSFKTFDTPALVP